MEKDMEKLLELLDGVPIDTTVIFRGAWVGRRQGVDAARAWIRDNGERFRVVRAYYFWRFWVAVTLDPL